MKKVGVIGLGQFGYQVATGLAQKGFDVIGFDENPAIINDIKDLIPQAVVVNSADELAMRETDIQLMDIAIVAFGSNVQSSLLTTALLQEMGIEKIYVRAISNLQEKILSTMGVTQILNIEKEMGIQLTNSLSSSRIGRYIDISEQHALLEVNIPENMIGKSLKEIPFRSKYELNVVGVKSRVPEINEEGEAQFIMTLSTVPNPDAKLTKHDSLLIAGKDHHIQRFLKGADQDG